MVVSEQRLNEQKLHQFLDRVVGDLAAGYGGVMVSLGHKLGLYKAMSGAGPLSSTELAHRSDCVERYVREWLNSQAAGGYVIYHPTSSTYELTPEQAMVLAHEDSPVFMPPAWDVPASMWLDEEKTIQAFKTGAGVGWGEHHARMSCGTAAFYRNCYQNSLLSQWLPALTGVEARLKAGAKVADVGCGHGHSTLIMAKAYPQSRFWGFDYHAGSIQTARDRSQKEGLTDRVTFEVAPAKGYPKEGFDLICFFDCLHDLGDPVGAAKHAAQSLAADGTVMLVEPFANDRVEDNLNTVGRLYYAASTTICCAHSLSEEVGLALGAQAGEERLAQIFREAGFKTFRRATETPFNLILEARL
ncbi:MAG: class I SAM-dependent methyltransferase [Anaerolineae bacterium]|nr:class I SAM-dependent methyltransferase [Gloeobacterales cyanobacterium ES-bin-313]